MKTLSSYPGAYERLYLIYPISCASRRNVVYKIPLLARTLGLKAKQNKGAFTYDVSSRGVGGFEMLTVADKGGGKGSMPC